MDIKKCGSDKKKNLRCPKLNSRRWEGMEERREVNQLTAVGQKPSKDFLDT